MRFWLLLLGLATLAWADSSWQELQRSAEALAAQGRWVEARAAVEQAAALVKAPADVSSVLRTRAGIERDEGDYAAAESHYRQAMQLVGPREAAQCLEELAGLHHAQGELQTALDEWDRVLTAYGEAYGPESPQTARVMASMGGAYAGLGDLKLAEEVLLHALTVLEETPGRDHLDTINAVQNIGLVYVRTGRYPSALGCYRRALRFYEGVYGPSHPSTVLVMQNLANALHAAGQLDEAESLFNRALQARPADNVYSAYTLQNLATLQLDRQEPAAAVEASRQSEALFTRLAEQWLSFTGEEERLDFLASQHPYTVYAGARSAPDLARAVLRWKGLGLESLAEDQRLALASRDPSLRALVERVRAANGRWRRAGTPAESAALAEEVRAGQAELARRVTRLGPTREALKVTVTRVQEAMPADAELVEFVAYPSYVAPGRPSLESYGAVVIPAHGEPRWVRLGSGEAVNSLVRDFMRAVRSPGQDLEAALRRLYQELWLPLGLQARTVILSPDGQLNFVSFAALLAPDGQLLGEKHELLYVASGRDLLAPPPARGEGLLALGNPAFRAPRAASGKFASRALGLRLASLPGTELEVKRLQELAAAQAWKPEVWLGAQASEGRLRAVRSPHILHLATHGFFLGGAQSPMDRSGVALAGAQSTLKCWARGEVPAPADDGILTAREASGLTLDQTWLVVLSACDSGLGESTSGEGVMGLRRALVLAGAQNLLLTLWPVPDQATADFMLDFYQALALAPSPPRALAQVQRSWLTRLRREKGAGAAVRAAGAFVVTFQGR